MKYVAFVPTLFISLNLIVVFYLNYFYLIPKLLLTKKYLIYIVALFLCIISTLALSRFISYLVEFNPDDLLLANPIINKISPIAKANAYLMFIVSFVTSILLSLNNRLKQTEKEKLSAQISSLKQQINPHFLFNVLNGIYSVTIGKAPKAADMVEKLSKMMRYTLHETQQNFVPIEKEICYIENYIDLQKTRFDDSVKIEFNLEGNFDDKQIAPLLLIPFVENAFKHGVNPEEECKIKIELRIKSDELFFRVTNKIIHLDKSIIEESGLGINNTRLRLQLIYPSKHQLVIDDSGDVYKVSLNINLT